MGMTVREIVQPFVGDRFGQHKPFGLSILVLGESSYNPEEPSGPLPSDWSKRIVQCEFNGTYGVFMTRCASVFFGTRQITPHRGDGATGNGHHGWMPQ